MWMCQLLKVDYFDSRGDNMSVLCLQLCSVFVSHYSWRYVLECAYSSCTNTPERKTKHTSGCTATHVWANRLTRRIARRNRQMAFIDSETDSVKDRHRETVSLHLAIHPSFGTVPCQLKLCRARCPPHTLGTQEQNPRGEWLCEIYITFIQPIQLCLALVIRRRIKVIKHLQVLHLYNFT